MAGQQTGKAGDGMGAAQALQQTTELTVAQVAGLKGCSTRYIRQLLDNGELNGEKRLNERNRPTYYIPLSALDAKLQKRYLKDRGQALPGATNPADAETKAVKPLESFTIYERAQINFWCRVLADWQERRSESGMPLGRADEQFVEYALVQFRAEYRKLTGRPLRLSKPTLYRYQRALEENDFEGLVDKRGQATKGTSSIPPPLWDAFLYYYLDEARHAVRQCYKKAQDWAYEVNP
ncbi:MAG: hypothetical protein ACK5JF_05305 [Oscillospiraceae bacterium]